MKKYENYAKHMEVLARSSQQDLENEFIVSGIIDKFFIQFELGWKLLKELLKYEGKTVGASGSPREVIKGAYACYDFLEEDIWLSMLKSRNDLAHIYDEEQAQRLLKTILEIYIPELGRLLAGIRKRYGDEMQSII
ncbi:MAG: nucleotidyltransferase [Lachnospiraceae bacterium]|nr:nucleotidyltransferase [Lachnospiraceae bacterium]MCI9151772.1 nucleotidyltransferase [Lachnospiraceae bacterium]